MAKVSCAESILRDDFGFDLVTDIGADADGLTTEVHADRVLKLVEVFAAALREVLVGPKVGKAVAQEC